MAGFIFKGRFFLMRMLMLASALALVAIGIVTIYTVGHPSEAPVDPITGAAVPPDDANSSEVVREESETPAPAHEHADKWQKQLVFAAAGFFCLILVNLF